MSRRLAGLLAGVLGIFTLGVLAPVATAAPATVRIAGDVVAVETAVETTADPAGPSCPGETAGGAIDKAVAGNWDRNPFVQTIVGETHAYTNNDYWNFWINDTYSQEGICAYVVRPGDRILMLVQRDNPATFAPTVFPLALSGVPASVLAGQPFTVTVNQQQTDGTITTPVPAAGATIAGAGASAQTDAAGHATLTLNTPGAVTLRATRAGNVASDAAALTVTAPAQNLPPCITNGRDGNCGTPDRTAPAGSVRGIAEGQRFARGKGPRELRVMVAGDPAGLLVVKLRLTRNDRGRCSTFSGKTERFRHVKCGASHGFWFGVGDRAETSYLLPSRLPRGRYVLDVNAIDKTFHRDDARRRGGNRVVFRVG
jgi:Domain of unknown function (DUF4430)